MGFTSLGHPASVWYKYRWPHYMVRWLETWWRQLWWRGPLVHPPPSITSLLLQISTLWEKKTIQPEERWFSQYFITKQKGEPLKTATLPGSPGPPGPGVWGTICLIYLRWLWRSAGQCRAGHPSSLCGQCQVMDPASDPGGPSSLSVWERISDTVFVCF